jgi:hypothetical protein
VGGFFASSHSRRQAHRQDTVEIFADADTTRCQALRFGGIRAVLAEQGLIIHP